jgi:RNA polymerase sigma factor (sigma-70 family)
MIDKATAYASMLQGRLGPEPQEIVSEAVLSLAAESERKEGRLEQNLEDRGVPFAAALFMTIWRLSVQARRVNARYARLACPLDDDFDSPSGEPGPDELAENGEVVREAHAAIQKLSPKAGEMMRLRYVDGLTPSEIAERTGTLPSSVHATLARARKLLEPALRRSVNGPMSE